MVMPHRRPSAAMRSIHRELERRRPKPLAPKRPAAKNPSAPQPSSHEASHGKIHKPGPRPAREKSSSIKPMARWSSASTRMPPTSRPRHQAPSFLSDRSMSASTVGISSHLKAMHEASPPPPFAASAPSAPLPRSASSSIGSMCAATSSVGSHLKPGSRVQVRTRTLAKIDGKTLVLWLLATVVSATDGSYEIIYDGNLPRDDPFSTIHVPLHHVRPIRPSSPIPPPSMSQPPCASESSNASTTNTHAPAFKSSGMLPAARPTTPAMQPNRPTTTPSATSTLTEASNVLPAPRPTAAGKSLRIIRKFWPELQSPLRQISKLSPEKKHTPRPTIAGKSHRLMCNPAPRPTTAGKIVNRILTEMKHRILDD